LQIAQGGVLADRQKAVGLHDLHAENVEDLCLGSVAILRRDPDRVQVVAWRDRDRWP
jgi:hypothetical protein